MTIKMFSTKLNSLAQYTPDMANTDKEKIKIFTNRLKTDMAKDVLIRGNLLRSYIKAVDKV